MKSPMKRRGFLRNFGAATAGLLILPSARTAFGYRANERLNLAVVGMAGYGAYHGFAESLHLYGNVGYAFGCDVDERKVKRVYDLWEKRAAELARSERESDRKAAAEVFAPLAAKHPPLYKDYRRMLDEQGKNIDAVVVATPDHTHAIISAAALRAGKPVLAEKPLTISPHEARVLRKLARDTKLPTQMNNGGTASPGFRRGVEIIREGLLGTINEVHAFYSKGGQNFQKAPQGPQEIPKELDWNLWLAQVKWREYHPEWINRIAWRETSVGQLGNFFPHAANMAFMGLDIKSLWDNTSGKAIKVTSECSEVNNLSYPRWEKIRWEIPAHAGRAPVSFTWHHGYPPDYAPGSRESFSKMLREHGAAESELKELLPDVGCLIVGNKGLLATTSHNTTVKLLPKAKFENIEQGKPLKLPNSTGHYREWIDACRGGPAPMSNFEYAAPFAEFLNIGSISTRFPGETLEFHPVSGLITNHKAAANYLSYKYREGWTI